MLSKYINIHKKYAVRSLTFLYICIHLIKFPSDVICQNNDVSNWIYIRFKLTQLNPVDNFGTRLALNVETLFIFIRFAIMHMRTKPAYTDDTKFK